MSCQAPDKFVAAAIRNPVCNLSLMVGTTDIPDWCYVGAYGSKGKSVFTEAPSAEHLAVLHGKSPISHVSKVCVYYISSFYMHYSQSFDILCRGWYILKSKFAYKPTKQWILNVLLVILVRSLIYTVYTNDQLVFYMDWVLPCTFI